MPRFFEQNVFFFGKINDYFSVTSVEQPAPGVDDSAAILPKPAACDLPGKT
jgi:hypothetical protein